MRPNVIEIESDNLEEKIKEYEKLVIEVTKRRDEESEKQISLLNSKEEMLNYYESLTSDIEKIDKLNKELLNHQCHKEAELQIRAIEELEESIELINQENIELKKKLGLLNQNPKQVVSDEKYLQEQKIIVTDLDRLMNFFTLNRGTTNNNIYGNILESNIDNFHLILQRENIDEVVKTITSKDQFIGQNSQNDFLQVLEFLNFWGTDHKFFSRDFFNHPLANRRKELLRNWSKKIKIQLPQQLKKKLELVMHFF